MENRSGKYSRFFTSEYLMGPNSICLLDELLAKHPLIFEGSDSVLDLGCGKGITSLFIANETGAAKVYANDLWVDVKDNQARFESWDMDGRIIPKREDASFMTFGKDMFSAVISIDAYHYFGGDEGFFTDNILPFVKPGGKVLIVVPGVREEYEGRQKELLGEWLGEEADLFKSGSRWKQIIGRSERHDAAETWELDCFDEAWESWLSLDNKLAAGDKVHYDTIKKYTCFVGIAVTKKSRGLK